MKNCVKSFVVFLLFGNIVFGTNYYVSPSGNDANPGTLLQPWRTLAKVSGTTFSAGDQILFERGGIYRGTTNGKGGSSGNPLIWGAYGSGAKPQLLGSTTINGWTSIGGNKWTCNPGFAILELFMNDKRMIMARYPNTGYAVIGSGSGTTQIIEANLGTYSPLTGGRVVVRGQNDWITNGEITGQSGNTINITGVASVDGNPCDIGKGFYVDRALSLLDVANEWYQNPSTFLITIQLPTGVNPNLQSFEGSVNDFGIDFNYNYHARVNDIVFKYYKVNGIRVRNTADFQINRCEFRNINECGLYMQGQADGRPLPNLVGATENITVDSCKFYDINSEALQIEWFATPTITRNIIKRTALIPGYERDNLNAGMATFLMNLYNGNISYNVIDSAGYSTMVWTGEKMVIERNEISNNGLTKNDNGFMQCWGGKNKDNIIRENICHDGWGNEEGMGYANQTKRGAAEGIYFDTYMAGNTVTGNTVYRSNNGIFIQSAQNVLITDNVCYDNDWNGYMTHEFNAANNDQIANGWSNDATNLTITGNVFYAARPTQRGMRWSSDRCNSPLNFGVSNNNYVFNPYSPLVFSRYREFCPGNENTGVTISQWRTLPNRDINSKTNWFLWSSIQASTTGSNLVSNGTFDANLTGWGGNGQGNNTWETNVLLNGGTLKASQTSGGADAYEIQSPNIAIQPSKTYIVSFSVVGNRDGLIKPYIISKFPNFGYLYTPGVVAFSTNRADYQFTFTTSSALNLSYNYGIHFYTQASGDIAWLDNISVFEVVSVQPDDYENRSKLFVNNQITPQVFSLGSNVYKDLDGNLVCGSITVAPYRSKILILQDGVTGALNLSGPTNTLCTSQKAVLTLTGASSGLQWQQSTDGSTWSTISGASMNIYTTVGLSANTYFRVAVISTVCGVSYSNNLLISVSGVSANIVASKNPICQGENVVMSILGVSSSNVLWRMSTNDVVWNDANTGTPNTNYVYTALGLNTNTWFSVSVNGVCGVFSTSSYVLSVNPNINPAFSYGWPTCNNILLPQSGGFSNSSIGFYSSTLAGLFVNSITGEISPSTLSGITSIKFTKYANGACPQLITSTSINLLAPPVTNITPNVAQCANIPYTITATGATAFTWTVNGFSQSWFTDIKSVSGFYNYGVRATDANNCRSDAFFVVSVTGNPLPTITGGASLTYCQFANSSVSDITNKVLGSSIRYYNVSVSGPFTTVPGAPNTSNAGSPAYSFWISQNNGVCESPRLKFDININPTSISNINPVGAVSFCTGGNVVLTSTSAINNQWYRNGQTISGANAQFLTVSTAGIYNLKVGSGTCTDTVAVGTKVSITPLPNVSLTVNPSSQQVCTGSGASISISNSESGIVYQPFIGVTPIASTIAGTGSTLNISIPSSNLSVGNNTVTLKATALAASGGGVNSILATAPLVIDGNLTEAGWNIGTPIAKCVNGVCPGNNTATFGTQWDNTYLYLGVNVKDNTVIFDGTKNFWDTDAIEIFIDGDLVRAPADGAYDANTKQYILRYGDPNYEILEKSTWIPVTVSGSGVIFQWKATSDGYNMEVAIPWARIGISPPTVGSSIAFDVGYDDNDGGINRMTQAVYAGFNNNAWDNRQFAVMPLIGNQSFCSGTVNLSQTVDIQVNSNPQSPIFNYGNSPICNSQGLVNLTTFSGSGGGSFAASGGLNINSVTGAISVTGFTGVSTITYATLPSGGCGSVTGFTTVTVNSAPILPVFNYGNLPICNSSNNISITTISGMTGGTFSISPSTNISVLANGNINISTLTGAGIYTISYSKSASGGCASVSGMATITVNSAPVTPTFNYGNAPICNSTNSISITTISGMSGGTFSISPSTNISVLANGNISLSTLTGVGVYTITYSKSASGGCSSVSGLATITVNSAPVTPVFNYGNAPICNSNNSVLITTISGVSGGTFSISPSSNISVLANGNISLSTLTGAGIYTITYSVLSVGGCNGVNSTATISIDGILSQPTISYTSPVCQSVGTLNPTLSNAIGAVFSYSTSGTNILAINTSTGIVNLNSSSVAGYTITLTKNSTNSCPSVSASANLTINLDDVATFTYPSATICNISPGTVLPINIGQTGGGTYSYTTSGSNTLAINSSTGEITPTASGTGNYTIIYQTSGVCLKSHTFNLAVSTNPTNANFSFTGIYCSNGGNAISVGNRGVLSVVSSTGSGTLVWADLIQGIVDVYTTSPNQTYTIQNIVSIPGCGTDTKFADITIESAPNLSISASSLVVCSGTGVTLTALGANTFNWLQSGNPTNAIQLFTPSQTQSYTVSGSNANCSSTTFVGITVNPLPTISISATPSNLEVCQGNNVSLTASGANNYNWGSINSNVNTFTPLNTSTYSVTGTDGNGCQSTQSVSVTVNSLPIISVAANPSNLLVCEGGNISLTASGANTYNWGSLSGAIQSFTPSITQSFSVTGTDINGCQSGNSITVIVSSPTSVPVFNYGNSAICNSTNQAPINIISGVNGGTFSINPSSNISVSGNGNIILSTLTAVNTFEITYSIPSNGVCPSVSGMANLTVSSAPNIPVFSYGSVSSICSSQSSLNISNVSQNISNATFSISPLNNGVFVEANTGVLAIQPSANGVFTISAANSSQFCGSQSSSVTLTVNGIPSPAKIITQENLNTFCSDVNVLRLNIQGGTGNGLFRNDKGLIITSFNTYGIVEVPENMEGSVSIEYVQTTTGCSEVVTSTSINFNKQILQPKVSLSKNLFCNENSETAIVSNAHSSGFFRSNSRLLSLNTTTGFIDFSKSKPGNFRLIYEVKDNGACIGKVDSISFNIIAPAVGSIIGLNFGEDGVCFGGEAKLKLESSIGRIQWQQKSEDSWVKLDSMATDSIKINLPKTTPIRALSFINGCTNPAISNEFTVKIVEQSVGGTVEVLDRDLDSKESELCLEASTDITLLGYKGSIQWQIRGTGKDSTIYTDIDSFKHPSAVTQVLNTPNFLGYGVSKYYRAVVKNGVCPADTSKIGIVRYCKRSDFVPNALTPLSGDQNSVWDLKDMKLIDNAEIRIFNRYGVEVFFATGEQYRAKPWDGGNLSAGTYYFIIDRGDGTQKFTGAITLVK